jgi:hypothetical protein
MELTSKLSGGGVYGEDLRDAVNDGEVSTTVSRLVDSILWLNMPL